MTTCSSSHPRGRAPTKPSALDFSPLGSEQKSDIPSWQALIDPISSEKWAVASGGEAAFRGSPKWRRLLQTSGSAVRKGRRPGPSTPGCPTHHHLCLLGHLPHQCVCSPPNHSTRQVPAPFCRQITEAQNDSFTQSRSHRCRPSNPRVLGCFRSAASPLFRKAEHRTGCGHTSC